MMCKTAAIAVSVFVALCGVGQSADRCTADLQARIDALAAQGGGTLMLTSGVYRTGALFFKPGVNLHLDEGAVIEGVDDAESYPMRETRIEGRTVVYWSQMTELGEGVEPPPSIASNVVMRANSVSYRKFAVYSKEPFVQYLDFKVDDL